jgi:hypothetical protein
MRLLDRQIAADSDGPLKALILDALLKRNALRGAQKEPLCKEELRSVTAREK